MRHGSILCVHWCFEIDNNQLEWNDLNIDLSLTYRKGNNIKRDYIQLTHDDRAQKLYVRSGPVRDASAEKRAIEKEYLLFKVILTLLRCVNFRLFR